MVAPSSTSPASYRFGNVELSPVQRRLTVDGQDAAVGARAFDVLLALIERRDRLVSRDELLDLVWPNVAVEPNNLAVQVGALRKALGPRMIATIPGRGYRFSADVDELQRPARSSEAVLQRRTNLPEQPPPLIGRGDDARIVGRRIDTHRIVTIVGAGGIGKSRLAQSLLHERQDAYRHGVCWVELASIGDASTLHGAIAAALGINLASGPPGDVLRAALAPLEILVALDSAEHLVDEIGRLVEALVAASVGVRFVITSQVPLRLSDEQVVRLGALAVPTEEVTADEAIGYAAVDLFVQRARAADARFVFNDGNASAVIRLCGRLDGLPLAIEFAAARAPLLGVDRITVSLDERLQVLKGGHRSRPARQRTMRATLEWSHHLLGLDERVVFRRLAVIAGSASLELIEAIVADPADATAGTAGPFDRWAVVDTLGELVDRSLVTVVADERDPDRPRYRLLETPRAYAAECLATAGEGAMLEGRHARAVAALFADAWVERWTGRVGFTDWVDRVEADRENARIALAWALRHEAFDLVLAIGPVLLLRSLPRAGYDERAAIATAIERALSTPQPEAVELRARLQLMRFWHDRDLSRSRGEARRALSLAETCHDRFAAYLAQAWLVRMHVQTGELDAAAAALERVDALEDPAWPAMRLWMGAEARSIYRVLKGPPESAVMAAREELRLVKLAGQDGIITTSNLVDIELVAGDAASAAAHGLKLLNDMRDSRHEFALLVVRINVAAALLALDDVARARPVAAAAWQAARDFALHGDCADYLALLCALEERFAAAAELMGYADAVYARRGAQRWPNEMQARDRTARLARGALGNAEVQRLVDDGARLPDSRIAAIAAIHAGEA